MKKLLFFAFMASCWAQATFGVISPSATVPAGSTVQFSASLGGTPASPVIDVQGTVAFPGVTGPITVTAGTAAVAATKTVQCGGTLVCLAVGANAMTGALNNNAIANGEVFHMATTIPATVAPGAYSFGMSGVVLADANGLSIPVTASIPLLLTITPPANKCDINQDGKVDITDVELVAATADGLSTVQHDLNADGVTNIQDVQIVIEAVITGMCGAK